MRNVLALCLMITGLATTTHAQGMSEETCDQTALIVSDAQTMRMDGKSGEETIGSLVKTYADLGEAYTQTVIPNLVNMYVYAQPEAVLAQDLGAFWKQTCLTADLSSVLPSE